MLRYATDNPVDLRSNFCGNFYDLLIIYYYKLRKSSIDVQVSEIFETRFVGRQDKLNKIIIHSSDTYVKNNSTRNQEGHSVPYSFSVTKTITSSVTISSDIEVKANIKIPFIADILF